MKNITIKSNMSVENICELYEERIRETVARITLELHDKGLETDPMMAVAAMSCIQATCINHIMDKEGAIKLMRKMFRDELKSLEDQFKTTLN